MITDCFKTRRPIVKSTMAGIAFFLILPTVSYAGGMADQFSEKKLLSVLTDHGIYPSLSYMGEFAANPHGGQYAHHQTYVDQFTGGLTLETQKLIGLPGGWLNAVFTNRHGHSLAGRYINTSMSVQQIYGDGQTYRLSTLSYLQSFANDRINLMVGRLPAKSSYFVSPSYCLFQSNAICGNPGIITRSSNPSVFPMPSWGGRLRLKVTSNLVFTTGVYEAFDSTYQKKSRHGFYWGTKRDNGVWIPAEFKYTTTMKEDPYPMMLSLGGAYDTGNGVDGKGHRYDHRVLLWTQAEKMIWKPDPSGARGIIAFAGLGLSTSKRQTESYQLLGGLHYDGPFAQRPDDVAAVMGTLVHRSSRNRNAASRRHPNYITFEANYTYAALNGVKLTPNIQYIIHPDGAGRIQEPKSGKIKNALVLGVQISVDVNSILGVAKADMPN